MSVIAAVTDGTRAYMAADSRLSLDDLILQQHPASQQKVARLGNGVLVGLAGYAGLCAALLGDLTCENPWPDPEPWAQRSAEGFEVYLEERGPQLRAFMAAWATDSPHGAEETDAFEALVACGPTIARLTSDGGITIHAQPYFAIGSGQMIALGALGALLAVDTPAAVAVRLAVDMACRHVAACGPPVVLVCSEEAADAE